MFKNFIIIVLGVMCVTMVKPVKKASANNSKFITIETSQGNVVIETLPKIAPNHVKRIKELVKTGFYDGIILRASINNSFNSKLTMRTKIQYSDFSNSWFIEPMITYQPNAFSALYFGINDLLETEDNMFSSLTESKRQLFIKFQYLF